MSSIGQIKRKILPVTKSGYSPSPADPEGILFLIETYGLFNLGGYDGCACTNFSICGITVDVSCRKSHGRKTIRVSSNNLGATPASLEAVAQKVQQSSDLDDGKAYRVRFCEYHIDHHDGKWEGGVFVDGQLCCYCQAPRADKQSYLCAACCQKKDAVRMFPWTKDGFMEAADEQR